VDVRGRNNNLATHKHMVADTIRPIIGAWVHRLLTGHNFVTARNPHALGFVPSVVVPEFCVSLAPALNLAIADSRNIVRFVRDSIEETGLIVGISTSSFLFEFNANTYVVKIDVTLHNDFQVDSEVKIRKFNQTLDFANGINNLIGQLQILGF